MAATVAAAVVITVIVWLAGAIAAGVTVRHGVRVDAEALRALERITDSKEGPL